MRTFKICVRMSRALNRVFHTGLDPGVIAEKLLSYTLPEDDFDSPRFIASLINEKNRFVAELITSTVNEVKETIPTQWEVLDENITQEIERDINTEAERIRRELAMKDAKSTRDAADIIVSNKQ